MKKITLSLIAIVFTINFSYAQWNSSGNNIYNTNTGAVGIGTTAPTAKLGVVGPSGNTIYSAQAGSGGEWAFGQNVGATSGDDTFGIYSYTWGSAHSSRPLIQFNSTGNTFLNSAGGNVGIGTESPAYKLQVGSVGASLNSNFNIVGYTGIAAANGNKALYLINDGTTLKLDAYDYGASSPLNFQLGGNGGNILMASGGVGNVGIGT